MNDTHKTSNLREISRAGRKAMGLAGAANLQAWKDRAEDDIRAQIDAYAADLRRELGDSPSCTRRALGEAVVDSYASLLLIGRELRKSRSKQRVKAIEHGSWLSGNLCRLLKALNLDARPRPRTLAEMFAAKVTPIPEIEASKGPVLPGKSE